MSLKTSFFRRSFTFNFSARTSRGAMKDKVSWFVKIWNSEAPSIIGYGECGPLPGLSIDDTPVLEQTLANALASLEKVSVAPENVYAVVQSVVPAGYPSITFALETALLDLLNGGKQIIFPNSFVQGNPIPINGLVWMGDEHFMLGQVHKKVRQGFQCIKLKIGGLDFDQECVILSQIRKQYPEIILRLDANGAFKEEEALNKLTTLSQFNIHSLEQPIRQGSVFMRDVCRKSPIPIALDEELIGQEGNKHALLKAIEPQYIILKPTLHGGLYHCQEWIRLAEEMGIGWWITSALESNIGLNAICQLTAQYPVTLPQGLGTGALYDNNIESPLKVEDGNIFYQAGTAWSIPA